MRSSPSIGAAPPPGSPCGRGSGGDAARRRGLEVFQQACAACHGLRHLPYHERARLGLSAERIREIAAERSLPTLDADG